MFSREILIDLLRVPPNQIKGVAIKVEKWPRSRFIARIVWEVAAGDDGKNCLLERRRRGRRRLMSSMELLADLKRRLGGRRKERKKVYLW